MEQQPRKDVVQSKEQQTTKMERGRWWQGFTGVLNWVGQHETSVLISLALIVGGVWLFIVLAQAVMEGETRAIDTRLLMAMRAPNDPADPIGPAWAEEMLQDFTALGGTGVAVLIALAASGFLVMQHRLRTAILVLIAVCGGMLLNYALKLGFDRPRPDLVPHETSAMHSSFPSGHSMVSAVVYLTLGALLAGAQSPRHYKAYILLMAVLVTFLVGVSRVYLGVHWPTDVLAGWTVGIIWALIWWLVMRWLQKRGEVEDAEET